MSNEQSTETSFAIRPPLRRCPQGRIVAGVASGLADHLQIDVLGIRVIIVALMVFGGIGVPLYIAAWLLIPEAGSEQSVAEELFAGLQVH